MHITVVGTGYVGLVAGACFAETGSEVTCADLDAKKVAGLKQNILPIYEPGLDTLVERNQAQGRLQFTTDVADAVRKADVIFIAVGTPPDEDGSADLSHVLAVAETIGQNLTREAVVVTKSTVPVGTADKVRTAVARHAKFPFHIVSNPEFLKEGAAVDDFLKPDRVVLGVDSDFARTAMTELYGPFVRTGKPVLFMDIPSAEMTKYAANAMLATRISFMNEIANLCERVGANVDLVRKGIGSDSRIGSSFLFPGPGYGGSCFPKDVKALLRTSEDMGAPMKVLRAVEEANDRQKGLLFEKLHRAIGDVRGKRIAIWGLAFKAQTDDMRESPALNLIDSLLAGGATVVAHDPAAMHEAERRLGASIAFAKSNYDALTDADALVVVTDWNEYRFPDFARIKAALRHPLLVDGRNLYDPTKMAQLGFTYRSIGRGTE
ncbi:MAG: UDP-glucose/GDP-mannose dehydrogenase family protein [Gemmatimonadota bacterium]|nr:UDP-glucose/GDP-mannose dehydrogenase family protein [Gemmatimonadota bacterium]